MKFANVDAAKSAFETPGYSTKEMAELAIEKLRKEITFIPEEKDETGRRRVHPENVSRLHPEEFEIELGGGKQVMGGDEEWYPVLIVGKNAPFHIQGMYGHIGPDGKHHRVLVYIR